MKNPRMLGQMPQQCKGELWGPAGVLFVLFGATIAFSPAAWALNPIHCPAGRLYRDVRQTAGEGRQQYCDLELPGGLVVKDGPYRAWIDADGPPTTGEYRLGREVGRWTECNRFNHCSSITYEDPFPEERKRKTYRPEIPVRYVNGKYRFDFASCRSTWITQQGGPEDVSLNIGGGSPYRCQVSWLPQHFLNHGGDGSYTCFIPYSVGTRTFGSLNLIKEFASAGLPQFCRPQRTTPEPLMIREGVYDVAYSSDVKCVSVRHSNNERARLAIQFNSFVANLLSQTVAVQGPLNTLLCTDPVPGPRMVRGARGATTFLLQLSGEPAKARQQEKCIRDNLPLAASCDEQDGGNSIQQY